MAKTNTEQHKFYVVDLVRKKPKAQFLEIPKYRVDVTIEVTTKGTFKAPPIPESLFKRLETAARDELEAYEKIIASEAERLDKKIADLMAQPTPANLKAAESLTQGVNQSIKNALASAEGAAQKAVEARLKKEAQGDKNLKEARVRTGVKWTLGVISVAGNVAKLVATAGADVTSYVAIAKTLYDLGSDLAQQLKTEEKLRKDLNAAIQSFITLRGTAIQQAAARQNITDLSGIDVKKPKEALAGILNKIKTAGEEVTKGKDKKAMARDVLDFAVKKIKSGLKDAEEARKKYREHTTKTRHRTDAISVQAGKLQAAMKSARTLKEGVRVGAECMAVKRTVSEMAAKLDTREKYLDEMQDLMKANGLEIDDRTTIQKIQALDKTTILTNAKDLGSALKTIKGTLDEIAKVAA